MSETKKNALADLADLAEMLKADAEILRGLKKNLGDEEDEVGGMMIGMMIDDVGKASRIVAELAKADLAYANDPVSNNCVELRLDAFKKCRAIAEERGVRDVK